MEPTKRTSICFVAHFAYGEMAGAEGRDIGGVQTQTSLMARWFARRGYRVTMATWDEGQKDGVQIDGVRMLKMCHHDAGIVGLRFFWPRWTSLNAALARADADVYYQNCAEYVTGQVALWCRRNARRFIYSVANDPDCDARLPEMRTIRERVLYRYGLTHADDVIVQTQKQREMLRTCFERDALVLPMPCPGPSDEDYFRLDQQRIPSPDVLWIGRICEQKRPDRLLDLAQTCPDIHFDLVGPEGTTPYAHEVCQRARSIANVTVHGPVSRDRVSWFYRRAAILCCTSDFEGFPNTFLEAWSFGLPIVSTLDPDDLIAKKGLGKLGKDVAELVAGLREMLGSQEKWRMASQSARAYYRDNHALDSAMGRFEQAFRQVSGASDRVPT